RHPAEPWRTARAETASSTSWPRRHGTNVTLDGGGDLDRADIGRHGDPQQGCGAGQPGAGVKMTAKPIRSPHHKVVAGGEQEPRVDGIDRLDEGPRPGRAPLQEADSGYGEGRRLNLERQADGVVVRADPPAKSYQCPRRQLADGIVSDAGQPETRM